jgi:predicted transcriptional regulator
MLTLVNTDELELLREAVRAYVEVAPERIVELAALTERLDDALTETENPA